MSDASASAHTTEIFIGSDNNEATDFTTSQWKETIGSAATEQYRKLRTSARRFIVIPLAFLALHAILASYHLNVWLVASVMSCVLFPLCYFWAFTKEVAEANTAAGMIERFDIYTYDEESKFHLISADVFRKVLAKHFTAKDLKKKERLDAANRFLAVHTGKQKFLMWTAVLAHVLAMVFVTGPFYGLAFVLTYTLAFIAINRYFRKATRQLRVLSDFAPKSTPMEDDANDDTMSGSNKKETKKDKSSKKDRATTEDLALNWDDELLLEIVTRHNNGERITKDEHNFLVGTFGSLNNVPSTKSLIKMMQTVGADTPEPASADTGSMTEGTDTRAPLPVRTPARHRRDVNVDTAPQTGSTGTPAHGTYVPSTPIYSDESSTTGSTSVPTPAPAPAAAIPTRSPEELDELFMKYMALGEDGMTDIELDALRPHLNNKR
ncbi:MAG TPA: hypothetical protein VJ843_05965 [Candidatus Saccharimonadales bacterium]|nr:hypothetical protein [Candidatus Saccharimonadales bacterium]